MERDVVLGPGANTQIKRHPERARYDATTVHAIIDEALICHVSFVRDGEPFTIPTAHVRVNDTIYVHGAIANRMCRSLVEGARACLSFTLLDGLVFARSAFSHSMNYRSVTAFGSGREVSDRQEKSRALWALVEHVAPGRSQELSELTDAELDATLVVAVKIDEAVAKVRTGPPLDGDTPRAKQDDAPWAGVLPLHMQAVAPVRDASSPITRDVAASVNARAAAWGAPTIRELRDDDLCFSTDKARLDVALIHDFLCNESYWARGVSLSRVETSIAQALCFGVYRGQRQIGFARVLTDGARFAYLGDVFVIAGERGRGIGKQLMDFVLQDPAIADLDRVLLGTADAHGLYARYGFVNTPPDRYMVKPSARLVRGR